MGGLHIQNRIDLLCPRKDYFALIYGESPAEKSRGATQGPELSCRGKRTLKGFPYVDVTPDLYRCPIPLHPAISRDIYLYIGSQKG